MKSPTSFVGIGALLVASLVAVLAWSMPDVDVQKDSNDEQGLESSQHAGQTAQSRLDEKNDADNLARCVSALGSDVLATRENAMRQLAAAQERAVPALARGVMSREPSVQNNCIELLLRCRDSLRRVTREAAEREIIDLHIHASDNTWTAWSSAEQSWRRSHQRKAEAILKRLRAETETDREGNLECVWLDGPQYDDAFLLHLRAIPTLFGIMIRRNSITFDGLLSLRQMPSLSCVMILNGSVDMNAEQYEELHVALRGAVSESRFDPGAGREVPLSYSERSIESALAKRGFTLERNKSGYISGVEARETSLTESDIQQMEELRFLDSLSLSLVKIRPDAWSRIPKLRRLRHLSFRQCGLNDDDLAAISQIQTLHTLSTYESNITDEGLRHLASMPLLCFLSVTSDRITDASIPTFQRIRYLNLVDLADSGVSDRGIGILKRCFPGLSVSH